MVFGKMKLDFFGPRQPRGLKVDVSRAIDSITVRRTATAMNELAARAQSASVRASSDDGQRNDPPPPVPLAEQSALKARDLGGVFANPESPTLDRRPGSGLTLSSNSPDAFKGREIRVAHAGGARFDDRTTMREEFPAHPVVSPTAAVRKQYAPSDVKFDGRSTMHSEYPAHPVSPTPAVVRKPYHMYEAKFEDNTTNRDSFPAHSLSPAPAGARKQYVPSDVKFEGRTTSGDSYPAHPVSPTPAVVRKPYRMYEAKFEDNTTNRDSFPAHSLSPAPAGARKQYVPSDVKFDGRTTSGEDFKGHEIETQRPSVGLWVENDRTEVLIHAGAALPARAARVFSTTEKNQTSVAFRVVQGWSRTASKNKTLCLFEMAGLQPGLAGAATIKITFAIDEQGVLTVEGRDMETGATHAEKTQTLDK